MGPFGFVIALVFIITAGIAIPNVIGQVLRHRSARGQLQGDSTQKGLAEVGREIDDLNGRLMRLEEERDFYRDLLESPGTRAAIPPPDGEGGDSSVGGP